jgi:hypothetical protein
MAQLLQPVLQQQLEQQQQLQKQQLEQRQQLQKQLEPLVKEFAILHAARMDPWKPSTPPSERSGHAQTNFKNKLASFYERAPDESNEGHLRCMVSDLWIPAKKCIASHIWKFGTLGDGLDEFGLQRDDLHSERNGLLMASTIEEAFDLKRVTFFYSFLEDSFQFLVLDKSLLKSPITPPDKLNTAGTAVETGWNFESIHGRKLQHPIGKVPFRRLLAWHYAMSVQHARWRMWITDADVKDKPPFTSSENLLTRSPTSLWPSTELLTLVGHACDVSEKDGDDSGDEEGSYVDRRTTNEDST